MITTRHRDRTISYSGVKTLRLPVRSTVVVMGGIILCVCTGCNQRVVPVAKLPPPEVTVDHPIQREFPESMDFTGRTESVDMVEIRARVSGYLVKVNFVEGEEVKKDTVLFEIDPRPFEAELAAAKADVARWQASLKKASLDVERLKSLQAKGAATQEQIDEVIAEQAISQASIAGAEAAVRQAELNLEFTEVKAPVDGRVSNANVTVGNLIAADSTGTPSLTTLVSTNPMYVYFDVDERSLLKAQRRARERDPNTTPDTIRDLKLPVFIGLADEAGYPHEGYIDFIDNRVESDTGTIRVRGHFDNKKRILTAGLFVRVRLPMGQPVVHTLITERAIGTDQGQKYVLVVDEGNKVEYRKITPGARTEDGLRAIGDGVKPDEWIIVNGLQRAQPGATVAPQPAAPVKDENHSQPAQPDDAGDTTVEP